MEGHEVLVEADGLRGVEVARQFRPEVVLCDIGLPGIGGYEVAKRLRSESGTRVVLVAVTGYSSARTCSGPAKQDSSTTSQSQRTWGTSCESSRRRRGYTDVPTPSAAGQLGRSPCAHQRVAPLAEAPTQMGASPHDVHRGDDE